MPIVRDGPRFLAASAADENVQDPVARREPRHRLAVGTEPCERPLGIVEEVRERDQSGHGAAILASQRRNPTESRTLAARPEHTAGISRVMSRRAPGLQ